MQLKMRLYKMHDYDLCKLYLTKGFNFSKHMKMALMQYSNGERYLIHSPLEISTKEIPTKIEIKLALDEDVYTKAILLLKKIKKRQQNSFLKSLFRQSLDGNILSDYFLLEQNDLKITLKTKDTANSEKEQDKKLMNTKKNIKKKTVLTGTCSKEKTDAQETILIAKEHNKMMEIKENSLMENENKEIGDNAQGVFDMFQNLIENY